MLKPMNGGEIVIIDLPAACTLVNIRDIAKLIRSECENHPQVIIDGAGVESADLSAVQLVVSAASTARAASASFELRSPTPSLQQAFVRAGLGGFLASVAKA